MCDVYPGVGGPRDQGPETGRRSIVSVWRVT